MPNQRGGLSNILPAERVEKIRKTQAEMKDIKVSMAMLTRMGMDTKPIREKMEWMEQMMTIMLEEYDKK